MPRDDVAEADVIYTAGLFDGEGSISLPFNKKNTPPTLQLQIAMTHRPTMEWFATVWGGRLCKLSQQKPHHLAVYKWKATAAKAAVVLERIFPYLRTKREQALIGLAARETHDLQLLLVYKNQIEALNSGRKPQGKV